MEKKSNHLAAYIVSGILTAFAIVACIISMASGGKGVWMYSDAANLLVCVLLGYYAFCGFRKPHGNLLRYIILFFAITHILSIYQLAELSSQWQAIISALAFGLCCYIAGRLHKVKQNIILMSIVIVLRLIGMSFELAEGIWTIGAITPLIILIDILVAYVLRYKDHKEAGLMDAPKAK